MRLENVVSPIPRGSARELDFKRQWHTITGGNFYGRGGGGVVAAWDLASNFGFPSSTEQAVNRNGVTCFRRRNGGSASNAFAVIPFTQQTELDYPFPVNMFGVMVWECFMEMPTPTTGEPTENGCWFSNSGVSRVWNAGSTGFGVSRKDADVVFFQNGPLGISEQSLGINPDNWNHFRWIIYSAADDKQASMELVVNGETAISKTWTDANNMPILDGTTSGAIYFNIGIATAGAADWVYYRDQHFFCGPAGQPGVL